MNPPLLQAVLPTSVLLLSAGLCQAQLVVDTSLGNSPYTINANTTQTATLVGNTASGTLTQTAGTFTVNTLSLGETATGLGQYNLTGGTLSATNLFVGNAGIGTMQTAGTVNFETLTLGQASGSSGSYTVNGGTLISSSSNIIFDEVFRLIIGANGAAALTLSNATASTKTFSTMIASAAGSSGTLRLGSGSTLSTRSIVGGAGNSIAIFDGGTLVETYSGATILSKLTEARVSTGGLAINVASGASSTLGQTLIHDSSISGPDGGLTMAGQGTLSITTPQHYTGPTTLAAGKVSVQRIDALGDGGTIRFTGGTLSFGSFAPPTLDFSSRFSAEGNQIFRVGSSLSTGIAFPLASNLSGSGSRFDAVGGTLVLSGTNTYTGTTTVSSGKLIATKPAALPGFATAGRVSVASGAMLAVDPGVWSGAEITQLSQAVTLASGATLGWEPIGADSISEGGIGGSVRFVKFGNHTVVLKGANTFSGGLRVAEGQVVAVTPSALPGFDVAGRNSVDANRTLTVRIGGPGQWTGEDLRILHANTTVAASGRIGMDSTDAPDSYVLSGTFTGTARLTKSGSNTLRLGNFTTAGSLDLADGVLSIPTGSAVNTAGLSITGGGRLGLAGTLTCDPAKAATIGFASTCDITGTLNAGSLAISGGSAFGYRITVNQTSGSVNASQWIQIGQGDAAHYNMSGGSITTPALGISGSATNSQPIRISTLTLDAGTIHVTSPTDPMLLGVTGGAPGVLIQNGGSIEIEGRGLGISSYQQAGFVPPSFAHLNGGVLITKSIYGVINGALDFNGGTVRAKAASTNFIDRLSPAILAGGAKVDSNGFDLTISTALRHDPSLGETPDGGLTKLGAGKLTLTGANTFTGRTTVAGGTLSLAPAAYATLLGAADATITDAAARLELAYGTAASPADAVRQAIASGRFIAAVANPNAVLGFGDSGSVVTLRATLAGDADLNGAVDFNDFLVLQNHFGQANTRFDQGDFNFNGTTDFNDFLVLQNHFGQSVSGVAVAVSAAEWSAVAAFTAVPEPATLVPVLMAGGLLRRRRPSGVGRN